MMVSLNQSPGDVNRDAFVLAIAAFGGRLSLRAQQKLAQGEGRA